MLTETESEIFATNIERNKVRITDNISVDDLNTQYIIQDNFTICIVTVKEQVLTAGVAKRKPDEPWFDSIGMKISFNEALRNILPL